MENKKENTKMNNMFNFNMPGMNINGEIKNKLAISLDGKIAYKKEDNSYITVDENGNVTNIMSCIMPNSSQMIMLFPVSTVSKDDIIVDNNKVFSVLSLDDNILKCIDLETQQIIESVKESNYFGMNFYIKATSFFNPMMMCGGADGNMMQQMMMFNMMGNGSNDMMKMMMMCNIMGGIK